MTKPSDANHYFEEDIPNGNECKVIKLDAKVGEGAINNLEGGPITSKVLLSCDFLLKLYMGFGLFFVCWLRKHEKVMKFKEISDFWVCWVWDARKIKLS